MRQVLEENRKAKLRHKWLREDLRYANQVALLITIGIVVLVIISGIIKYQGV